MPLSPSLRSLSLKLRILILVVSSLVCCGVSSSKIVQCKRKNAAEQKKREKRFEKRSLSPFSLSTLSPPSPVVKTLPRSSPASVSCLSLSLPLDVCAPVDCLSLSPSSISNSQLQPIKKLSLSNSKFSFFPLALFPPQALAATGLDAAAAPGLPAPAPAADAAGATPSRLASTPAEI